MGRQDSRVVVTLNFWTLVHYALGHEVYPWWQLFFSAHREDRVKEAEKQLIILLFVKKLLKFVLFMKVWWKLQEWRIKLLKNIFMHALFTDFGIFYTTAYHLGRFNLPFGPILLNSW